MRRTTQVLFLSLLVLAAFQARPGRAASGPEAGPEPVVASGAGLEVTAEVFALQYGRYLLRTGAADAFPLRRDFLRSLIDRQLVVLALRAQGVTREEGYRHEAEAVRQKLLLAAYAERVLFDTLRVSDAELRALFTRINTRVTARHLYAPTRAEADALYARLQSGARFEDLAREVFADSALAANGGLVGTFGFDEMDPAFEAAAYALDVGAVSEPVPTARGYSVIRVEARHAQPLLTEADFAAKAPQLRIYALRRKRADALAHHSRSLAQQAAIVQNEAARARLLAQIEGALAPADEAAFLREPLVTFGAETRTTWTVADFREAARFTDASQRGAVTSEAHLSRFIDGLVVRALMLAQARAAGLDREPVYGAAFAREMEGWLYREAQARAAATVTVNADSVRAHFARNRGSYRVPERVQVGEILVATKAEALRLKAMLGASTFTALARVHSIRPGADAGGGDLGYVDRDALGHLADEVFGAAEGDVLGPLEVAGRYVLLRVGPRRDARAATLEEVEARIRDELRERSAREAFAAYLEGLRAHYGITIDEGALAAVRLPEGV